MRAPNQPAPARCGAFPIVDHLWTRPSDRRWLPIFARWDGAFLAVAQKISGSRNRLWFASPVEPPDRLERTAACTEPPGTHCVLADHGLAFLVPPITCSAWERQFDLSQHVLVLPQAQ